MLEQMGIQAKQASKVLARVSDTQKNEVLLDLADQLWDKRKSILAANQIDIENSVKKGISGAFLDRLTLTEKRIKGISDSLKKLVELPDPVGQIMEEKTLPNGLKLYKQRVPIGVLAVIYEARPNVTVDVSALAIKTGNAVILRGGSNTINTNRAIVKIIHDTIAAHEFPNHAVQFIDDTDRARVLELLKLHQYVDMLIPRGAAKLHQFCRENSLIPVITGGIGICHLFVDETCNLDAALPVIQNAKVQRPTVCNALDTILVHQKVAKDFIPRVIDHLSKDNVIFKVDQRTIAVLGQNANPSVELAGENDFDQEWLSLTLSIKIVAGLEEAIEHVKLHSTGHSDGILTQDEANAQTFIDEIDSSAVYVNASTRFTDGSEFGLGAEVAISTQRLHARGPMGLPELTIYKWVIRGDYQTRA